MRQFVIDVEEKNCFICLFICFESFINFFLRSADSNAKTFVGSDETSLFLIVVKHYFDLQIL